MQWISPGFSRLLVAENAENASQDAGFSLRGMTSGRLQEYLGPRPSGCGVGAGRQRLPKQGRKSVGVARHTALGKVASCQAGMFLAYVSWRALVDKRLYLPESWTSDKARAGGRATGRRPGAGYAAAGLGTGPAEGWLGCGGPMSPPFREGLAPWGWTGVPAGFTARAEAGRGAPRKPRLVGGQRRTMEERSNELPEEAWRSESQGPSYSAPEGSSNQGGSPAKWAIPPESGWQPVQRLPHW